MINEQDVASRQHRDNPPQMKSKIYYLLPTSVKTQSQIQSFWQKVLQLLWRLAQDKHLVLTHLKQAIKKAETFGFDLDGAVMASDAFFPFPDCVEIAHKAGIKAVIQPGGSIKDQLSIDYCKCK